MIEPTDRSIPPKIITIVIPHASITLIEICLIIFVKFLTVKNLIPPKTLFPKDANQFSFALFTSMLTSMPFLSLQTLSRSATAYPYRFAYAPTSAVASVITFSWLNSSLPRTPALYPLLITIIRSLILISSGSSDETIIIEIPFAARLSINA